MPTRYFVFGPNDATQEEFDKYVKPQLEEIIRADPSVKFVLREGPFGKGIDLYAYEYLDGMAELLVYCKLKDDKNESDGLTFNKLSFIYVINQKHNQIDTLATISSDEDIYWVRTEEEKEKMYGEKYDPHYIDAVQRNIMRREAINKYKDTIRAIDATNDAIQKSKN